MHENVQKIGEKLRAKLPASTRAGYSMEKIARFDDSFSEFF